MKNSQIAIIIAIALLIGYAIASLMKSSTYSSFADADRMKNQTTTVIGILDREKDKNFNPQTVTLTIGAVDKEGNSKTVIYNNTKPQDFERSEEITMKGYSTDSVFIASQILMKCPSKYNEENKINSEGIYY